MIAAKTFKLNADGKCYVLHGPEASANGSVEAVASAEMDAREGIVEAARSCPVQAIRLYEDDGTEIRL